MLQVGLENQLLTESLVAGDPESSCHLCVVADPSKQQHQPDPPRVLFHSLAGMTILVILVLVVLASPDSTAFPPQSKEANATSIGTENHTTTTTTTTEDDMSLAIRAMNRSLRPSCIPSRVRLPG